MKFQVRARPSEDEDEERLDKAWRRKWEEDKYMFGREGDHLMTPFECDLYIFRKLKNRSPIPDSMINRRLIACIRRVNLDAL